jgi:hypothetical protein
MRLDGELVWPVRGLSVNSRRVRVPLKLIVIPATTPKPQQADSMADFFNLKARQQAAAQASSSKSSTSKQEPNRLQPWVEK